VKWIALVLAAGCAGTMGEIVTDTGALSEATGVPDIRAVAELGGGDVSLTSDVSVPAGDGVATVGEALWVRGSNFGRRPTVTVAGRPAAVLARTADGGLVVRVPPASPAGAQTVVVANDQGHAEFGLTVRRLVATLAPAGGRLELADLALEGPRLRGGVPASGQMLRVGSDGRAAYVLDAVSAKLTVFELAAPQGPRAVFTLDLAAKGPADPVIAFSASGQSSTLMIVRSSDLMLLDATSALHPVRSQPRPLPAAIRRGGVAAAALSPDGRVAAIGVQEGNRVALLDLRQPGTASIAADLAIASDARVPVVVDLAFAPDGRTLWVALGDTPKSRAVGPQPTEIVAVRIGPVPATGGAPAMTVARRVRIDEAEAPVRLNTGRAIPLASGASIRLPPERATVYLTALGHGGIATVFRLGAEDRATPFVEVPGNAGAADLSPDGRWLLVPVVRTTGRLAIVAAPADGRPGERQTLDLGPVPLPDRSSGDSRGGTSAVPSVAAQP
jgi:hypothetical protein